MTKKQTTKYIIEMVLIFTVTTYAFRYILLPIRVDGNSMYPTLHDQDLGVVNACNLDFDHLERFDIVILYSEQLEERIVKRVIGFSGEKITYRDDKLYINDKYYAESFLDPEYMEEAKQKYNSNVFTKDFEITVEEGKFFVLGDNRLNSADSRVLGCFSLDDLMGKDGIILYPFTNLDWIN